MSVAFNTLYACLTIDAVVVKGRQLGVALTACDLQSALEMSSDMRDIQSSQSCGPNRRMRYAINRSALQGYRVGWSHIQSIQGISLNSMVFQGLNLQITNAVLARLTIFRYDVTSKATSIKPSTTQARATAEKYRDLWPAVRQALALAAAVCKSSPWILRILAWFFALLPSILDLHALV